jgi:hypothetical protein
MQTYSADVLTRARLELSAGVCAIMRADRATLSAYFGDYSGDYSGESLTGKTDEEIRALCLDFVREECFSFGIHCADIGL